MTSIVTVWYSIVYGCFLIVLTTELFFAAFRWLNISYLKRNGTHLNKLHMFALFTLICIVYSVLTIATVILSRFISLVMAITHVVLVIACSAKFVGSVSQTYSNTLLAAKLVPQRNVAQREVASIFANMALTVASCIVSGVAISVASMCGMESILPRIIVPVWLVLNSICHAMCFATTRAFVRTKCCPRWSCETEYHWISTALSDWILSYGSKKRIQFTSTFSSTSGIFGSTTSTPQLPSTQSSTGGSQDTLRGLRIHLGKNAGTLSPIQGSPPLMEFARISLDRDSMLPPPEEKDSPVSIVVDDTDSPNEIVEPPKSYPEIVDPVRRMRSAPVLNIQNGGSTSENSDEKSTSVVENQGLTWQEFEDYLGTVKNESLLVPRSKRKQFEGSISAGNTPRSGSPQRKYSWNRERRSAHGTPYETPEQSPEAPSHSEYIMHATSLPAEGDGRVLLDLDQLDNDLNTPLVTPTNRQQNAENISAQPSISGSNSLLSELDASHSPQMSREVTPASLSSQFQRARKRRSFQTITHSPNTDHLLPPSMQSQSSNRYHTTNANHHIRTKPDIFVMNGDSDDTTRTMELHTQTNTRMTRSRGSVTLTTSITDISLHLRRDQERRALKATIELSQVLNESGLTEESTHTDLRSLCEGCLDSIAEEYGPFDSDFFSLGQE